MSTSAPNPEVTTRAPSKADCQVLPTTSRKGSPRHEPTGTTQKVLAADRGNKADLPPAPGPGLTVPRPIKTVECNMMSYTDGEGVARRIYMPKRTMSLASALLSGKRFDDLARFPVWDNQTYDDWETDEEKYAYLWDDLGDTTREL